LHVEPFELLNHDTEIDDVAYIVEKMRVDEEVAEVVRRAVATRPDAGVVDVRHHRISLGHECVCGN
jgi:hypothetical protein